MRASSLQRKKAPQTHQSPRTSSRKQALSTTSSTLSRAQATI